jgi:hypothetical protein
MQFRHNVADFGATMISVSLRLATPCVPQNQLARNLR